MPLYGLAYVKVLVGQGFFCGWKRLKRERRREEVRVGTEIIGLEMENSYGEQVIAGIYL